ncbi:hypothetical protein M9Y10_022673 [Tritrichomonas musculus]|uniref:Peroxin-12 n=1 Tax=Tritrichomonas musculus TaxID=1915356 RepID=A0ABR2KSY5_9EUKA
MIRLYLKAFKAQDEASIEKAAQDTVSYCLERNNERSSSNKRSIPLSLLVTSLESQGILSSIVNYHDELTKPMVISYSIYVPLWITMEQSIYNKCRIVTASILQGFPWTEKFHEHLRIIGAPPQIQNQLIALIASSYQVLSIKLSHGINIFNLFDTGYKIILVTLIHLVSRKITSFIHEKLLFFIPEWIISSYIAFETAPFLQRMVRFGIVDAIQWLMEFVIHTFTYFKYPIPELPEGIQNIPQTLMCAICHDFLTDPVEISGFFICSDCFNKWIAKSPTIHPVTGAEISREMISYSNLMNFLSIKYKKKILTKYRNEQNARKEDGNEN